MTKSTYAIIFFLSNLLCFLCFLLSIRSKHRFRLAIANVTGAGSFTTTAYLFALLFNSYLPMKIAYCIYFFSMDWLCVGIFFFTLTFTNLTKYLKNIKYFIIPIILLDSISQLLNILFNHSVLFHIQMYQRDMFFDLEAKWPFKVHLFICYVLIVLSFMILVWQVYHAARIYGMQCLIIFVILVGIVIINAFFTFKHLSVDVSIIGYGAGASLISYYTLFFLPRRLKTRMSRIVLDDMKTAIILFDPYGEIIYENAETENWTMKKGTNRKSICELLGLPADEDQNEYQKEIVYKEGDQTAILDVHYCVLREQQHRKQEMVVGSYFVMRNITERRKNLLLREHRANHDVLTGLYNKSYFCEQAEKLIKQNPDITYCIVMTNMYQFKIFNEVFGRDAGDRLLQEIARMFEARLQNRNAVYGRYESDRFVMCLPLQYSTKEKLETYHVSDPIYVDGYQIINYIGVCKVESSQDPVEVLCERAGIALNTIKGDAARRVAYYNHQMKDNLMKEKQLVAAFPKAMNEGAIVPYIQKQINQKTGELVGGEVLTRWINKDGSIVSPGVFIPLLEQYGMITQLDTFIWDQTCQIIRQLQDMGYPTALSVNLSAQDFFRLDIYKVFTELVSKYQIDPKYLKLEITESEIMADVEKQVDLIRRLQQDGFCVEMDDFGSGYSSLNTLKDIPVDVLKMDMKFFENTDNLERCHTIIRNITQLAHDLGIPVIAEGVEQQEQADLLMSMNCNYIQGYLFGKPMPLQEFIEYRRQSHYADLM